MWRLHIYPHIESRICVAITHLPPTPISNPGYMWRLHSCPHWGRILDMSSVKTLFCLHRDRILVICGVYIFLPKSNPRHGWRLHILSPHGSNPGYVWRLDNCPSRINLINNRLNFGIEMFRISASL